MMHKQYVYPKHTEAQKHKVLNAYICWIRRESIGAQARKAKQ